MGRAVPHIVSTGDVPRLRPVLGGAVPQQKRRSVSAQIRSVSERRPCGLVDSDRSDTGVNSDRVQRRVHFDVKESNALRGVGRRAVSSEQQELADLKVQSVKSVKSNGPSLVARRVYKVPLTSELQTAGICVRNNVILLSAEPRAERKVVVPSARSFGNDKILTF